MKKSPANESQTKSKERVRDHGEVFTAEREVKAMCDLVKDETERIDSRFLEPACGDGNFLAEILTRKLQAVKKKYGKSVTDYEKNSLLAVSGIYGVDILYDNVLACRKRMFDIWNDEYSRVCKGAEDEQMRNAIKFILQRNIVCGNALTLKCVDDKGQDTDEPIVFSEWAFVTGSMLQRSDYSFAAMLADSVNEAEGQLSIFDLNDGEGRFLQKCVTHYKKVGENGTV